MIFKHLLAIDRGSTNEIDVRSYRKLFQFLVHGSPIEGPPWRAYCAGGAFPLIGSEELVSFDKVAAVYERSTLEWGTGEALLLTQKIKTDGKVYENGSRQMIAAIDGDKMWFELGA